MVRNNRPARRSSIRIHRSHFPNFTKRLSRSKTRRIEDKHPRPFYDFSRNSGLGKPQRWRQNDSLDVYNNSEQDCATNSFTKCLSNCCCCSCCCCCCLNLAYIKTRPGMLRAGQLVLSWICSWLLGRYSLRVAGLLGTAMPALFSASAGGAMCAGLLLGVALLSKRSLALLRASLFELAFHSTAVALYATQGSFMHVATTMYLGPYKDDAESHVYEASVAAYWLAYLLAVLHALDAVYALHSYRRSRR